MGTTPNTWLQLRTLNLLLSLCQIVAVTFNCGISINIVNAFLYGDLHGEVCMEEPPKFVAQSWDFVHRLRKFRSFQHRKLLYNLKQSPRTRFKRFDDVVNSFGLKRHSCDHFVFYKVPTCMGQILLVVCAMTLRLSQKMTGTHELEIFLRSKFQTKDLGN